MKVPVFITFLAITFCHGVFGIPLAIPDDPKGYQLRRLSLLEKMDTEVKYTGIQDGNGHDVNFYSRDNDLQTGRAEDGGVFAYGDKGFYGSMGSRSSDKYIERGTSWDNVIVVDDEEEDTKRGFITVDVIPEDTVEVQNQTPAFDVRSPHDIEIEERDEEGSCATCLKRDSETRLSEPDKVFVHWSKDLNSGSSGYRAVVGDTDERSDTGRKLSTIMSEESSKEWDKRMTHSSKMINKRVQRANRLITKDSRRPIRTIRIDEGI